MRFTYRLKTEQLKAQGLGRRTAPPPSPRRAGASSNFCKGRASGVGGVQEPVVASKGSDQVVVELPGVKDLAKAEAIIGSSARIEFYHARNTKTAQAAIPHLHRDLEQGPAEPCRRLLSATARTTEILPGTPEYAAGDPRLGRADPYRSRSRPREG